MKPNEFWNSTYREVHVFTQANLSKVMDDMRTEIKLQEAITDKLIMADAMSQRRPKVIPLQKTFQKLFPENEDEIQTPEEITRRMRAIMKNSK